MQRLIYQMRCYNIGHDTDNYGIIFITLQELTLFLVSNFFQYKACTKLILSSNSGCHKVLSR